MKWQIKRKAFSLLTAIFVIVLMATVAILVLNISGKLVKETTAQYQNEQAALYANSYTEYAILAVTGNDRTVNCLSTINSTIGNPTIGNGYRIRTHIAYIGTAAEVGNCATTRKLSEAVTTVKTPLTIIVDAYVDYKEPDHHGGSTNAPWITYHKRTVQKI
ncbi:type II secretion system protein [Sulfurovum sp.]|uniref:type II secretion system protein n=1 Tax=Sulfurovum sp. TaxID=1969726 RepID=UPI0035692182